MNDKNKDRAMFIPICPRCMEGKVIVAPKTIPPSLQPHEVPQTYYCDHYQLSFPEIKIIWKKI